MTTQRRKPAGRLVKTRRTAAAAIILVVLLAVWLSFLTRHLHTCDDQVARVGRAALVTSCRPMAVTDAPMLALLIAAGLLLWPELAALEIFGVFRLERRLEEQARRQEDIAAMIHKLEMAQQQRTEVTTNLNVTGAVEVRAGELTVLQDEKEEPF